MFRPHRRARRYQSLASRRPARSSVCAPRGPKLPHRGRRSQARLASARSIGARELRCPPAQSRRVGGSARHDPVHRFTGKRSPSPMTHVLLNALLPIFAVIALGYLAGWVRVSDHHLVGVLIGLVSAFALPAVLLMVNPY